MAGTVIIPWYATGFRAEGFEGVVAEVAKAALRYGALSYGVYRARDDRYKFQQFAEFGEYLEWERYWEGPEMLDFRAQYQGWYQVPVLYGWWDIVARGEGGGSANGANGSNGHAAATSWPKGPTGESA